MSSRLSRSISSFSIEGARAPVGHHPLHAGDLDRASSLHQSIALAHERNSRSQSSNRSIVNVLARRPGLCDRTRTASTVRHRRPCARLLRWQAWRVQLLAQRQRNCSDGRPRHANNAARSIRCDHAHLTDSLARRSSRPKFCCATNRSIIYLIIVKVILLDDGAVLVAPPDSQRKPSRLSPL
jgi:hypothetical protein